MEDTNGVSPPLNSSGLLSDGRSSRLRSNLVVAAALVPGFVLGQCILIPLRIDNWALCFGLCLGGFVFAMTDAIVESRAR